jgi:serine/threonine protein kinase
MHNDVLSLCGQVIDGRYRVECCIGQGGMGVVWRVRHVQTRQLFALKTVRGSGQQDRKDLRRLLHEARATAAIQSRHVIRVIDVKPNYIHDGNELPFIVMEFLEGRSLSDYLESAGTIDAGELIWLMRQVSHGLLLAHEKGITHRDLKPSNIFLAKDEDGRIVAKLCDFGIAKLQGTALVELAETGALTTETGTLFGTPRYMAPEQLRRAEHEGPNTDQWAFGLIAFRALTGQSYFGGARNLAELILAIVHEPMPEPSSLMPSLPKAFDAWFLRSCARNPAERFVDVESQQRELELALGSPAVKPIEPSQLGPVTSYSPHPPSGNGLDTRGRIGGNRSRFTLQASSALFFACLGLAVLCSVGSTNWLAAHLRPSFAAGASPRAASVLGVVGAHSSSEPQAPALTVSAPSAIDSNSIVTLGDPATLRPTVQTSPRITSNNNRRSSHLAPKAVPSLLPRGAPCVRSAQCTDGLCAAEVCQ